MLSIRLLILSINQPLPHSRILDSLLTLVKVSEQLKYVISANGFLVLFLHVCLEPCNFSGNNVSKYENYRLNQTFAS